MAFVCPDTGNSLTAPVILMLIVLKTFLEGDQTVSADKVDIPSELQQLSDAFSVSYWCIASVSAQ